MTHSFKTCEPDIVIPYSEDMNEEVNVEVHTLVEGGKAIFQYRMIVVVDESSEWTPEELLANIALNLVESDPEEESE